MWWKEEVAYQIYPKSFYDSNNDGIGDIKGITQKLDYLEDLGVSLLWLCPIFKSPMDDNGYDISDYKDINPEFGNIEDLEELIQEAKSRGIKIILDLVINHSSDEHKWFKKALEDKNSKYRNYYIFKEGKNGKEPNNWRSHFGGSVWEKVKNEDNMYYLHLFSKKQPDFNWENEELRKELYKIVNYWLDKGIYGYRVDAINSIKKDQRYLDLPVDGVDGLGFNIPYTLNQPGIEIFLKELKDNTFSKYNCVTVAETPELEYERYPEFIGEEGFFSMAFDFNYVDLDMKEGGNYTKVVDVEVAELRNKIFESQEVVQKYGWGAPFLENHDNPRSIDKYFGKKGNEYSAKLLANLFFFLSGTPFIYQGQEIGMRNFERNDVSEFDDIASKDQYYRAINEGYSHEKAISFVNRRSRDNSRSPFHWDDGLNAGFTKSKNTWIKLAGNHKKINLKSQINDKNSVYNHYKNIIKLRKDSIYKNVIIYGKFIPNYIENDNIISYFRKDDNITLLLINNLSDKEEIINFNYEIKNTIINNYNEVYINDSKLLLKPYQSILFQV